MVDKEILMITKASVMWRTSKLITFHKNDGDVADYGNYRDQANLSHP